MSLEFEMAVAQYLFEKHGNYDKAVDKAKEIQKNIGVYSKPNVAPAYDVHIPILTGKERSDLVELVEQEISAVQYEDHPGEYVNRLVSIKKKL